MYNAILEGQKAVDRVINGVDESNEHDYNLDDYKRLAELDRLSNLKSFSSTSSMSHITTKSVPSQIFIQEVVSPGKQEALPAPVAPKKRTRRVVHYDGEDYADSVPVTRASNPKVPKEKSIAADLEHYEGIPDYIKKKADSIYKFIVDCNKQNGVDLIKRSVYRKMLIYLCLDIAYKDFNTPMIPNKLCAILHLTKGDIKKCSSKFSALKSNFVRKPREIDPLNYFKTYVKTFNTSLLRPTDLSDDAPEKMQEFCVELLARNPYLGNYSPGTLYAAIFYYFVHVKNGIPMSAPLLKEVTMNSNATDKQGLVMIRKAAESMSLFED